MMKTIEELLAERKPTLIELLWDNLIHYPDKWNEFFGVLEHWAERYAWINYGKKRHIKNQIWDKLSFWFWKLRHPKSR